MLSKFLKEIKKSICEIEKLLLILYIYEILLLNKFLIDYSLSLSYFCSIQIEKIKKNNLAK